MVMMRPTLSAIGTLIMDDNIRRRTTLLLGTAAMATDKILAMNLQSNFRGAVNNYIKYSRQFGNVQPWFL